MRFNLAQGSHQAVIDKVGKEQQSCNTKKMTDLINSIFLFCPNFFVRFSPCQFPPDETLEQDRKASLCSLPFFVYCIFACLRCSYMFSAILLKFDYWTFTMEPPDSCATGSFGMTSLRLIFI